MELKGEGVHILGIPLSGWAPSLQTFRMWEMEDERSAFPAYQVSVCKMEREGVGAGRRKLTGEGC